MTPILANLLPWGIIGLLTAFVVVVSIVILIIAHTIGPKAKRGPTKDSAYESGMPIVVDTERRFFIKFYVYAMLFLLFDVEIVLIWPWARAFYEASVNGTEVPMVTGVGAGPGFLLAGMGVFFFLLLFGFVYELKKGALEWH